MEKYLSTKHSSNKEDRWERWKAEGSMCGGLKRKDSFVLLKELETQCGWDSKCRELEQVMGKLHSWFQIFRSTSPVPSG